MHLGDIVSFAVMEYLRGLCRVEAVRGNCDLPDLRRELPVKKVLDIEGRKIGLIHGSGGPAETLRLVRSEFHDKVDVALFGHTHVSYLAKENGTLFFNPGSMRSGRDGANSYGILHLESEPWGEIINIEK